MTRRWNLALADVLATLAGAVIGFGIALALINEIARRHFGAQQ